jgi:hypothetical protein
MRGISWQHHVNGSHVGAGGHHAKISGLVLYPNNQSTRRGCTRRPLHDPYPCAASCRSSCTRMAPGSSYLLSRTRAAAGPPRGRRRWGRWICRREGVLQRLLNEASLPTIPACQQGFCTTIPSLSSTPPHTPVTREVFPSPAVVRDLQHCPEPQTAGTPGRCSS